MKNIILLVVIFSILLGKTVYCQDKTLMLTKIKNGKSHYVHIGDKVQIKLINKNYKIKKARLIGINNDSLIFDPINKRYMEQIININDLSYIGIKTFGRTVSAYTLNLLIILVASIPKGYGSIPTSYFRKYKPIYFDLGNWNKEIVSMSENNVNK
ncbi:MAG: hypothetical protein ABIJ97_08420 [Bacteroidota bacterium]